MEILKLVRPVKEYEQQAFEYINEFKEYNSNINGAGGLSIYNNYDKWLQKLEEDYNKIDIYNKVPSSTYFCVRENDNKIIGMANIRHELNNYLLQYTGHIGYSVRPTERKKGYAKKILYLGIKKCKSLGIDKVLLTCSKENIASAKTIISNLGIFEDETYNEKENIIFQRYWINVNELLERKEA